MNSILKLISSIFWLAFYLVIILGGVALWGYIQQAASSGRGHA